MRNSYAGDCFRCGAHVPAGSGFVQRKTRGTLGWWVRCKGCIGKGNEPLPRGGEREEVPNV